ncbi:glycosyltransferase [Candidatus Sumerlaeota bacterium]|nr:glycosyltransferase [Candidatus Sumerlaeota bacterium]
MTLQEASMIFLLGVMLPAAVFLPLRTLLARSGKFGDDETDSHGVAGALLGASILILSLIRGVFDAALVLPMMILVAAAAVFGTMETRFRLPSQFTIPIRLSLAVAAYALGFAFHPSTRLSLGTPFIGWLIDFSVTIAFYLGVMTSIEVLDRLRGLASGVATIMAFSLLVLMLNWSWGVPVVIMIMIAGLSTGHLFLVSRGRHTRFGTAGQLMIAMLLSTGTIASRAWGFTLGILFIALVAVALPMVDSVYTVFYRLGHGRQRDGKSYLKSMLLMIGFTERFVVYALWIVTLLFGVVLNVVYKAESLTLAIAVAATFLVGAIFMVAVLTRVGERMERTRNPDKLRILFLSHYFYPEVNAPASRLFEHARLWVANGHHVTIVCPVPSAPRGWPFAGYANAMWNEELVDGIRVVRVWTFIAANRGRIRRTLNYMSYTVSAMLAMFLLRRHDVMIATSPQFFCGMAGAIASRFRKERFILEIRDLWPESIEAVGAAKTSVALNVVRRMARWMYRQADTIVTVGDGYRERLIAQGAAPPGRIAVVTNGVDLQFFGGACDSTGIPLHSNQLIGKFVVSYVGTIGLAHGLDVILRAAEISRNAPILYVVAGDGAERERLQAEAEAGDLSNVIFTGLLPKEKIPALIGASGACLVHLRDKELFTTVLPSKMFEAMVMKRPIILGIRGHSQRLLEASGAGIAIAPEDGAALAEAAKRLAGNPAEASRMGENGLAFVREHYSRSVLADKYLGVMREVLLQDQEVPENTARTTCDEPASASEAEQKSIS